MRNKSVEPDIEGVVNPTIIPGFGEQAHAHLAIP